VRLEQTEMDNANLFEPADQHHRETDETDDAA